VLKELLLIATIATLVGGSFLLWSNVARELVYLYFAGSALAGLTNAYLGCLARSSAADPRPARADFPPSRARPLPAHGLVRVRPKRFPRRPPEEKKGGQSPFSGVGGGASRLRMTGGRWLRHPRAPRRRAAENALAHQSTAAGMLATAWGKGL
jgi:hypothetical protein